MKSFNIIKGTPGPILLPAKSWEWVFIDGPFTLDIPREGVFVSEEDKEDFCAIRLEHSDDVDVWVDFGVITKSLFASKVYPDLGDTQVFSISSILLDEDKNLVTVVGNVLERYLGEEDV